MTAGYLTEREACVLRLRADEEASWAELAGRLGLTADNAAAIHCRAVPKLRVFVFCCRQDLCGGRDELLDAFARANSDTTVSFSQFETDVFRHRVINGNDRFRREGWKTALRSACQKVARHLDFRRPEGLADERAFTDRFGGRS